MTGLAAVMIHHVDTEFIGYVDQLKHDVSLSRRRLGRRYIIGDGRVSAVAAAEARHKKQAHKKCRSANVW